MARRNKIVNQFAKQDCLSALAMSGPRLSLPDILEFEQWNQIGIQLESVTQHIQWWWGDWLNFGESRYGEKYQAAVEKFGLNLNTAQQYAWVAREYETCDRSQVSWTHYKVAAGMQDKAERAQVLELAGREHWSVARLRLEIKVARTAELCHKIDRSESAALVAEALPKHSESDEQLASQECVTLPTSQLVLEAARPVPQCEFENQDSNEVTLEVPRSSFISCQSSKPRQDVVIGHLPLLAEELQPLLTKTKIQTGNIDVLKRILTHVADFCDGHPDEVRVILKHFKKLIAPRRGLRSRINATGNHPGNVSRDEQSRRRDRR